MTCGGGTAAYSASTSELPPIEDRALVERALVGHLAGVERRRLVEDNRPFESRGAAGRARARTRQQRAQPAPNRGRPGEDGRWRRSCGRSGAEVRQASTSGTIEHSDIIAIVSGDHRVANVWREMREDARAQRADADPRAGRA